MKKADSPKEVKTAVQYARQVITNAVCASIAADGALEQKEKFGEEYVDLAVQNAADAVAKYNALADEIKEAQASYQKEVKTTSTNPKKKPAPQAPDKPEPTEAAPVEVETDPVRLLTKQLHEMRDSFQKDCPVHNRIKPKNRMRLHGTGIKTLGFVLKVFDTANLNPKYAPHYLNVTLLDAKLQKVEDLMSLKTVLTQFIEVVDTAYLIWSDNCYHDALKYYDSLREAVKRTEDSEAVMLFKELQPFFKSHKKKPAPRASSKLVNENQSPLSGG